MIDRSLSTLKGKHAVFISILNRKVKYNPILGNLTFDKRKNHAF